MKYFKQETEYTCGLACVRMILYKYFKIDVPEYRLINEFQTNNKIGTHPDNLIKGLEMRGFEVIHGQNGNIDALNRMRLKGYTIILAISVDAPHYVVYLGDNNNHCFFNDPHFGENFALSKKKFLSPKQKYPNHRWRIKNSEFNLPEYDFSELESNQAYFAVRPVRTHVVIEVTDKFGTVFKSDNGIRFLPPSKFESRHINEIDMKSAKSIKFNTHVREN